MKENYIRLIIVASLLFVSWKNVDNNWISEKHNNYNLVYTSTDKSNIKEYEKLIENGITTIKTFFHTSYNKEFSIFIHPSRKSLDSVWQKDWNMPGFKSECWMVASGVATKLDMISPKRWETQSCEHIYMRRQFIHNN